MPDQNEERALFDYIRPDRSKSADTVYDTKTAPKPYPLGPHIPTHIRKDPRVCDSKAMLPLVWQADCSNIQ